MKIIQDQKKRNRKIIGRWSKAEHSRFIQALGKYSRDWAKIQACVKTRCLSQVRSHAQKVFLKMPEQDIYELFGDEKSSESSSYTEQEISYIVEQLQKKQNNRLNLVDIFMEAFQKQRKEIDKQQKQSQQYHDIIDIKQESQNFCPQDEHSETFKFEEKTNFMINEPNFQQASK